MVFEGDSVEALMKPPCETKIFDSEADPCEVSTSEHGAEPAMTQSSDRWVSPRAKAAKDMAAKDTVVLHLSDTSPWVGEDDDDEDVPDSWDSLADD